MTTGLNRLNRESTEFSLYSRTARRNRTAPLVRSSERPSGAAVVCTIQYRGIITPLFCSKMQSARGPNKAFQPTPRKALHAAEGQRRLPANESWSMRARLTGVVAGVMGLCLSCRAVPHMANDAMQEAPIASNVRSNDEPVPTSLECQEAWRRAQRLWPEAQRCTRDSECVLYPCSCSSIGDNEAAHQLKELDATAGIACGWMWMPYCGPTTPRCVEGSCRAKGARRRE